MVLYREKRNVGKEGKPVNEEDLVIVCQPKSLQGKVFSLRK